MFSLQKIATVSGLVGGLALVCVGTGHAYADARPGGCETTAHGGTVCVRKNETRTDKDGTHSLNQEQNCSTADRPRVVFQEDELTNSGSANFGQVVDCSNRAELPKGFKKPNLEF
ncbi:hypothetical protein ACWEOA_02605 [Streptomyces sp. NPDC004457]|uniref:hypothetical protein n=1 Tax=Streptomyces spinosus TaxID=2872623 RepID=UPI001CED3EE6|nr:hypothetical protein [Streptomyces spinosus]